MSLETLGVGLIIPIFTIIMDPNIAAKYPTAAMLLSNLSPLKLFFNDNQNISSQALLISGAIIIIILVYSVKACFLVFLSWRQRTFVTKLGRGWSANLFSGYFICKKIQLFYLEM